MNRSTTLSLTALITLLMVAAALPAALAQNATPGGQNATQGGEGQADAAPGVADTAEVRFVLQSEDSALVAIEQSWEGQRAQAMRQSLDAFFGAGDGTLTPDEVDRIERASEQDLRNQSLPLFFYDGSPVQVADVQLEIEGAAGEMRSTQPLAMRHTVQLNLQPNATDADEHTLIISPLWPGRVAVSAAEGWHVAGDERLVGSPGVNVTGVFTAGEDTTVMFVRGDAPAANGAASPGEGGTPTADEDGPQESTGGAQPGERPSTIPGPAGILTLVALAAAVGIATLTAARRKP